MLLIEYLLDILIIAYLEGGCKSFKLAGSWLACKNKKTYQLLWINMKDKDNNWDAICNKHASVSCSTVILITFKCTLLVF